MNDKIIKNLCECLGVSVDEAREIAEADYRIDKGEKLFELTPEQQKASKAARTVPRAPTAYKFNKRERKTDTLKADLLQALMVGIVADVKIINPEREFEFEVENRKFRVVLSCPRS